MVNGKGKKSKTEKIVRPHQNDTGVYSKKAKIARLPESDCPHCPCRHPLSALKNTGLVSGIVVEETRCKNNGFSTTYIGIIT